MDWNRGMEPGNKGLGSLWEALEEGVDRGLEAEMLVFT